MVAVTVKLFNITKTLAHSSNFINSGINKVTAFKAGLMSGLSSGFDVGTKAFGNGAGGFIARSTAMGIVGGTASALGGGKFSNGAMSGAFTHMFNAEGLAEKGLEAGEAMLRSQASGLEDNTFMLLPFGKLLNYGESLFGSKLFGVGSSLFGHNVVKQGVLNVSGKPIKIGWSSTGQYGGGMYMRLGIGTNAVVPKYAGTHFKVPGTFVPNAKSNPIIKDLMGR